MFEIDISKNRIYRLQTKTFSELKLKERENLQEWLANTPNALGEELLIIQKEFDGFAETQERLDLLAIDKDGTLVVIENKLDDSGRDVVWQALKYVAYCSSLKKPEIIKIFQDYLRQQGRADDASAVICDFLESETIEEVDLNSGSGQRFILVAANFRKEVTSTVLWLISKGIRAQCMKVTLYMFSENPLLDINQIIPTPEAEDYMISMLSKDTEEKETKTVAAQRERFRERFWEKTLDYFRTQKIELYRNISPSRRHWLSAGSGSSGCAYGMIFSKSEARVEFYIDTGLKEGNKRIFDFLHDRKQEIEERFGSSFVWERLDDKKGCRIRYHKPFDGYNEENWPEIIEWLSDHIQRLETALRPVIPEIPNQ